jgi:hypothetical protein
MRYFFSLPGEQRGNFSGLNLRPQIQIVDPPIENGALLTAQPCFAQG